MNRRKALFGLAILGIALLVLVAYHLAKPRSVLITGDGFEGVVFDRREAVRVLGAMLSNEKADYWTPRQRDIEHLESRLRAYAQQEHPQVTPTLSLYKRQYFGFTREGARRILVIGFCDSDRFDWTREFAAVPASAGCHFEAEYDVATDAVPFFWSADE